MLLIQICYFFPLLNLIYIKKWLPIKKFLNAPLPDKKKGGFFLQDNCWYVNRTLFEILKFLLQVCSMPAVLWATSIRRDIIEFAR